MAETQPDWKDGFLFVGNQLALDLLNTRPVIDGTPTDLLTDFDAVLRWFRAAELIDPKKAKELHQECEGSRAGRAVEKIREFRELLRKEVLAWEGGAAVHRSAIEEINALMASHPMRWRLRADGPRVTSDTWFDIQSALDLFAPLARAAAELFTKADRSRVRKCSHGDCVLHFLDTSKNGTRRWCSMKMCGNRLKVASYASRQRN